MPRSRQEFLNNYDSYILNDTDVEEYKKAKRLSRIIAAPASFFMLLSMGGGLLIFLQMVYFIVSVLKQWFPFLRENLSFVQPPSISVVVLGVIAIIGGVIIGLIFLRVDHAFRGTASETGITSKDLDLHILAESASYFKNEEYGEAISSLERLVDRNQNNISRGIEVPASHYIEELRSQEDEDYLIDTLPDVIQFLYEEVTKEQPRREKLFEAINSNDSTKYRVTTDIDESPKDTGSVGYLSIIAKSLPSLNLSGVAIKFWMAYVIAAGVGIGAFLFGYETFGIIAVTIMLTGLQIYDRRARTTEETE